MTPNRNKRLPERIVLFTDFGEAGLYTGQMEAVLFDRGVNIPVIRLISDAPKCNPRASAYLLEPLSHHLPKKTLFLSVVDPGVGGSRLPLLVETEDHWFVGPDNGLFSRVLHRTQNAIVRAIDWRPDNLSVSFHGRDLFAPVAAAVAVGSRLSLLPLTPTMLEGSSWPDHLPEIVYVDHYGNLLTGISAAAIRDDARLLAADAEIPYARVFSEMESGQPFWYRNSIGLVEIAVNRGSASALLGLEIGQAVAVIH